MCGLFIGKAYANQPCRNWDNASHRMDGYLFSFANVRGSAMAKFAVGALVKHKSGDIKGVIDGVTEQEGRPTWYRVEWDDGTFTSHAEHELRAATTDGPQLYKKLA